MATKIVERSINRVFDEIAGLDGDDTVNLSELYVGILLVYHQVNKYSPGHNLNPPSRKEVEELLKTFDLNKDGVLQRDEFHRFCRKFAPNLTKKVLLNTLLVVLIVPSLVFVTKRVTGPLSFLLPEALLSVFFLVLLTVSGYMRVLEDAVDRMGRRLLTTKKYR